MRQLSTSDWTMVTLDAPNAHNTIGMAGFYDAATRTGGPPTYEDVVEHLRARLHVSESFRERILHVPLGLDRPYWIRDEDFDLEYHVRHIALPKPGTWRQFCTQVARIHSRPLDMTRPPWELYLIDGLDSVEHLPEGAFSAFLRIHHATIDGVAGAQLLTAIHSSTPDEVPPPPEAEWTPDAVPSDGELLARATVHGLSRPVEVVKAFRKLAPQIPMMVRDNRNPEVTSPATLPVATRFNQRVSPHRVFGTAYSTLDTMKEIRTGMPEAKVNDIGLAVVGGAIRAYLLDKGELPDESLVAMMPISIRPTMTRSSTVGSADSSATGGNQFSIAPITMATDEPDPFDRLARIVASTSHVKESGAHPVRLLMEMSEEALGGLMGTVQRTAVRALSRRGRSAAVHTLVSNVPGPSTAMYFCGAKMVDITGLGPVLDGMALNNGIGSYDGRMTFCFTADREAMPDPERYEECIVDAIDELVVGAKEAVVSEAPSEPGLSLVIGGGGAIAIGISAGILLALRDAGVDVARPTTAIGTSAGATVAADIQLGMPLDQIADRVCTDLADDGDDGFSVDRAWRTWPELARRAVGASWVLGRSLSPVRMPLPEPPGFVQRYLPGALLSFGESDDWATEYYADEWPEAAVWTVAFDVDAHRRVVLSADGVDGLRATLPRALQASCAIPALYAPVRVGGARLVDGGIKSASNFDVAARLPQRAVIGISSVSYDAADPPVGPGRLLRTFPNRSVLREIAVLRRRGHEVLVLHPSRTALELAGTGLLSGRISSDVVEAAYEGASHRLTQPDMQRRLERVVAAMAGDRVRVQR